MAATSNGFNKQLEIVEISKTNSLLRCCWCLFVSIFYFTSEIQFSITNSSCSPNEMHIQKDSPNRLGVFFWVVFIIIIDFFLLFYLCVFSTFLLDSIVGFVLWHSISHTIDGNMYKQK